MAELFIRLNAAGDQGRVVILEKDTEGKFTLGQGTAKYYPLSAELLDVIKGYKDQKADAAQSQEFKDGEALAKL